MPLRVPLAARAAALLCLALAAAAHAGDTTPETPDWMTYDAVAKRVKMAIVAGKNTTNGGWNFNGYAAGTLTITVPVGWNVEMDFRNDDVLPHSLVVMQREEPLPPLDGKPAFPRAFTVDLVPGIPQTRGDTVSFVAKTAGTYRIFCGVPTHGTGGMWDWFVVSADAQFPSARVAQTLDGHAWARMTEGEKLRYLEGFLAGQAVRQAVERLGRDAVEPAALARAIEALRQEGALTYPFSPTVYKTRLEDFFFYQDRRAMPLHEALAAVNVQLRGGGR